MNPKYFYKFSYNTANDANSLGFYWAEDDGAPFASGAHKAWLEVDKSKFPTSAKGISGFALNFDDTTSLDAIQNSVDGKDSWYTLNGVKLQKRPTQSGIYIHNGKKVVIR